jgi:hypothetical protein
MVMGMTIPASIKPAAIVEDTLDAASITLHSYVWLVHCLLCCTQ